MSLEAIVHRTVRCAQRRRWLALITLFLLVAGCDQSSGPTAQASPTDEWHVFEGTWTATGTRRTLQQGVDQRSAIFDLTGSLLLTGPQRPGIGFKAQAIGFSNSRDGMVGRAVWTDDRGEKVYSELKGEAVGSGKRIVGTFVGGTGRYAGVSGDYSFQWQYVVDTDDGEVSGRVVDFKGRARFGQSTTAPAGGSGR